MSTGETEPQNLALGAEISGAVNLLSESWTLSTPATPLKISLEESKGTDAAGTDHTMDKETAVETQTMVEEEENVTEVEDKGGEREGDEINSEAELSSGAATKAMTEDKAGQIANLKSDTVTTGTTTDPETDHEIATTTINMTHTIGVMEITTTDIATVVGLLTKNILNTNRGRPFEGAYQASSSPGSATSN